MPARVWLDTHRTLGHYLLGPNVSCLQMLELYLKGFERKKTNFWRKSGNPLQGFDNKLQSQLFSPCFCCCCCEVYTHLGVQDEETASEDPDLGPVREDLHGLFVKCFFELSGRVLES